MSGSNISLANILEKSFLTNLSTSIKNNGHTSSASMTRPNNTTAYVAGYVVGTSPATNLEFTNVSSIAGGTVIITAASLRIDADAVPTGMGPFRVHFFDRAPTAIADGVAFTLLAADRDKYIGYIDLSTPVDNGATLWTRADNVNMQATLASESTSLYAVIETRGGYTPSASIIKVVKLHTLEV